MSESKKWCCDRCGKELEEKKDFNCLTVDSWGQGRKGPLYLCKKCFSWFSVFMDGTPVENEVDFESDSELEDDFEYFEPSGGYSSYDR